MLTVFRYLSPLVASVTGITACTGGSELAAVKSVKTHNLLSTRCYMDISMSRALTLHIATRFKLISTQYVN